MNAPSSSAARFVGQRVSRKEDRRLLTGRGAYVDDIVLPGMLHLAFVRSPLACGQIMEIDVDAARTAPGVRAVYTAKDLNRLSIEWGTLNSADRATAKLTLLAEERVCYVGDPVAMIVADSRYIAEDAAALVKLDCASEDPVVSMEQAKSGPPVHGGHNNNLAGQVGGAEDPEVTRIFANAKHVVTGTVRHQRQAHCSMETRGAISAPHDMNDLTVYLSCQSPHIASTFIARTFGLSETQVRVISKDVGGAFGLKGMPWREELAVVAASLLIQRPVKWIEDRVENLVAANQAREQVATVKLALDAEGALLAADVDYESNNGAYPHSIDAGDFVMIVFSGPYHLPKLSFHGRAYYTNTAGLAAYRGPWMMESLARETMLDVAARQIGMDPIELRRRNLITRADQPFTMPTSGLVLDHVTPRETLDLALKTLGLESFRAEQAAARAQGRYLGLGVAVYVEPTTMAIHPVLSTEIADIRIEPSGKVTAMLGTHSQGHGTETTMAQIIADQLGVDVQDVTVREEDSSRGGFGAGAGGSRQAVAGGGAARRAAALLREKIKTIAGHLLNASPDSIRLEGGVIRVAGVEEMTTTMKGIAQVAYFAHERLPPGMEPGLAAQYRYRPPPIVFSNAAHACVVEVDVSTGMVQILRWIASEDCGVQINPAIVEGQVAGGVAQAIGGVLMEEIRHDENGNPTTVTFKDYLIPTIHDVPVLEFCHLETPAENEGGFKGVGEGGAIIGPPTLVNAIADALSPFGVRCLDLPLSPARIIALLDNQKGEKP